MPKQEQIEMLKSIAMCGFLLLFSSCRNERGSDKLNNHKELAGYSYDYDRLYSEYDNVGGMTTLTKLREIFGPPIAVSPLEGDLGLTTYLYCNPVSVEQGRASSEFEFVVDDATKKVLIKRSVRDSDIEGIRNFVMQVKKLVAKRRQAKSRGGTGD